jgi:DNA invertase Pin-like site-specific DNA recombinase
MRDRRAVMPKVLGYARVSTGDGQDVTSQKTALEALGAVVVFTETANGSSLVGRDQLEAVLRLLDKGDVLLALHPDRLARDTGDLLTIAKRVVERGAILRINDPAITFDGTDVMAEVMLTLFGMVAMMEKHFIKARQRRGIEAAKLKGNVYRGRQPTIDPSAIIALRDQGLGATAIARRLNIGRASVYRALAA